MIKQKGLRAAAVAVAILCGGLPAVGAGPAKEVAMAETAKPIAVVNERMRLYNAHSVEDFLKLYDPSVIIYDYPNKPMGQGIAHLRGIFEPMFAAGKVRVEIKQQIEMGAYVVNDELVHYPNGRQRYVSIYEVKDGLIASVRFVR